MLRKDPFRSVRHSRLSARLEGEHAKQEPARFAPVLLSFRSSFLRLLSGWHRRKMGIIGRHVIEQCAASRPQQLLAVGLSQEHNG
jgi:hypothetical protein